ncbi:MAG: fasciclin domain-containing protein [Ignavibacterium sp.]
MNTIRLAALTIIFFAVTLTSVKAQEYSMKSVSKDIVTTAVDAGVFKTLATALTEAGLIETLQGKGPFTVFAPTDDAFAKLPKGTVEALLKDKEALKKILLYHVVSGNVMSSAIIKSNEASTIEGSNLKITVKDGNVMINDAKVIKGDVKASNGVIHIIDTVLLPPTN